MPIDAKVRLAAVQMVSGRDWQQNLESAGQLIADAVSQGANVVLLPENFACFGGHNMAALATQEATSNGPIRQQLSQWARQYRITIVAGSLPSALSTAGEPAVPGKVFPACWVYGSQGEELARYDKLHLFDVDVADATGAYRESDHFQAGDKVVDIALPGSIQLGLSICYDLRFAELYRVLFQRGVNLLTIPAAFTYVTGEAHWMTLLRARAIENSCYVLAANQGGWHGSGDGKAARQTYGHSCIISPWGEVLGYLAQGEGVVLADFDAAEVERIRQAMPMASHQRLRWPELDA